jgi:hypothetical protein
MQLKSKRPKTCPYGCSGKLTKVPSAYRVEYGWDEQKEENLLEIKMHGFECANKHLFLVETIIVLV